MIHRGPHGPDAHHLTLCFLSDGTVDFYPETRDPAALARCLAALVRVLVEHPSAIACAAGHHRTGTDPVTP